MKIKNIIQQLEHLYGRQSEKYLIELINDGLKEIAISKKHYREIETQDLVEDQRWYDLPEGTIDVHRVEIKGTDDKYVMIPKLSDPHTLLREDEY